MLPEYYSQELTMQELTMIHRDGIILPRDFMLHPPSPDRKLKIGKGFRDRPGTLA